MEYVRRLYEVRFVQVGSIIPAGLTSFSVAGCSINVNMTNMMGFVNISVLLHPQDQVIIPMLKSMLIETCCIESRMYASIMVYFLFTCNIVVYILCGHPNSIFEGLLSPFLSYCAQNMSIGRLPVSPPGLPNCG